MQGLLNPETMSTYNGNNDIGGWVYMAVIIKSAVD